MKVSIGIPFYNPGEYFRDAIASVLAQTFPNFELILLDDGSTDNAISIAQSFNDKRIRIISDGDNLGLPTRLNQLINHSKGEYIARMDADDLISVTRIAQQVEYLDKEIEIDLVSTGLCSITNDCTVIGYRNPQQKSINSISAEQAIFGKADIAHATIMARRNWYIRNQYNEQAKLMEDYQLWIDAAIKNDLKVGHIYQPLYFYREESSVSSQKAITAYKNQLSLVSNKYFIKLSLINKMKFSLKCLAKIFFVFSLNFIKKSNKLLNLRNKSTLQDQVKLDELQQELNQLRKINEQDSLC